jgi:hypothetical protein
VTESLAVVLFCLCGSVVAQEMRNVRADEILSAEDYISTLEREWEVDRYLAKQRANPLCCPECRGAGTIIEGEAGRMTCFKCNGDGLVRESPKPQPQLEPDHKPNKRGQRQRKLERRLDDLERELVAIKKLLEKIYKQQKAEL